MRSVIGARAERTRLTDEDLLVLTADGDERSFELLYERHGKVAWSFAHMLVGEDGVAEDLVQEAFLAVWSQAGRDSCHKGSARTWILGIVHNRAVDRLRQGAASRRRQEVLEHVASASDGRDAAAEALGDVPDNQLQVIRLAYYGGYTHHEIAEILSVPLGTVKSRMRLGLECMHRALDPKLATA